MWASYEISEASCEAKLIGLTGKGWGQGRPVSNQGFWGGPICPSGECTCLGEEEGRERERVKGS